jgi:methylenetetrahydrofolate--tRNA-(uracil-5-)-methyltransferase
LGILLAGRALGTDLPLPPPTTALGSLLSHLSRPSDDFQPSNVVFSMFPALDESRRMGKRDRHALRAERALVDLNPWLVRIGRPAIQPPSAASEILAAAAS